MVNAGKAALKRLVSAREAEEKAAAAVEASRAAAAELAALLSAEESLTRSKLKSALRRAENAGVEGAMLTRVGKWRDGVRVSDGGEVDGTALLMSARERLALFSACAKANEDLARAAAERRLIEEAEAAEAAKLAEAARIAEERERKERQEAIDAAAEYVQREQEAEREAERAAVERADLEWAAAQRAAAAAQAQRTHAAALRTDLASERVTSERAAGIAAQRGAQPSVATHALAERQLAEQAAGWPQAAYGNNACAGYASAADLAAGAAAQAQRLQFPDLSD
eukprot:1450296-Pleurochrysis_carterae.AAC.1